MSGLVLGTTYNDIIDKVVAVIKSKCKNINDVSSLPACYKANFNLTYDCEKTAIPGEWDSTENAWTPTYTIKINSYVSAVTEAKVKSQLESFLKTTCKLGNNTSAIIKDKKFLKLMHNILSFCTTKCMLIGASPFDTGKYEVTNTKSKTEDTPPIGKGELTYKLKSGKNENGYLVYDQTASTNFKNVQSLEGTDDAGNIITATEVNTFLKVLMTTINQTVKVKKINYTVTFTF